MDATLPPPIRSTPGNSLELVLHVLPILKELTGYMKKDLDPCDRRHEFLDNIHRAAINLSVNLSAIEEAGKSYCFVEQIASLADLLEELFSKIIDFTLLQEQKPSHDPSFKHRRLWSMQSLFPVADNWEYLVNLQILPLDDQNISWDQIQDALKKLSDELQRSGEDTSIIGKHQEPETSPEASNKLISFAERIFSTLHVACSKCGSEPQREGRLRIGAYNNGKQGQAVNRLCILLSSGTVEHIWHEILIHDIQKPMGKTRVGFAGQDETGRPPEPWRIRNPESYQCICSLLDTHSESRSEFWRLNIILDPTGEGVQNHMPDERTHKRETLLEENTLKTLISLHAKNWTSMTKLTLGLTLCYSLFHFYGGSWTKERWSRRNIVFFGNDTQIPLRPFLSSDPQKLRGPPYDPNGYHRYPEFLELGVILLEIHLGQSLESFLGHKADISNSNELWCSAAQIFKKMRPDFISIAYRDAIQKCLLTDFSTGDACDDQMLRYSLFDDIVKPLEMEVGKIFKEFLSVEALDEEAEKKINLGSKADVGATRTVALLPSLQPINLTHRRKISHPQDAQLTIPPSSREDFEIAIVCALPLEYDAVCVLIDKFWDEEGDPYGKSKGDLNVYTTGRIGKHDIVLVLLPEMGKVGAASATASLRSSFPGLKLILLTGICGGVPNPGTAKELLLGDVVLSSSVFQYDFGRLHSNKFVPKKTSTDSLGRPGKKIRSLLKFFTTLRGRVQLEKQAAHYLEHIQEITAKEQPIGQYICPGAANDKLFGPIYVHKHYGEPQCACKNSNDDCEDSRKLSCHELQCDEKFLIERHRIQHKLHLEQEGRNKEAQAPMIFLGSIGSGDTVMRSSEDRDRIATEYDLIAFEMEGAGAWDELPCIIIKGICDYADSHKNKMWQHFAAATAASVMKALLEKYA